MVWKQTPRPRFQCLNTAVPVGPQGGHEEHRNRLQLQILLQFAADRISIHPRHDDIEQDYVRIFGPGQFETLRAREGRQELRPGQRSDTTAFNGVRLSWLPSIASIFIGLRVKSRLQLVENGHRHADDLATQFRVNQVLHTDVTRSLLPSDFARKEAS